MKPTKRIRHFLIRSGLIKPKNLAEIREVFTFPTDIPDRKRDPIWVGRHMERMGNRYVR